MLLEDRTCLAVTLPHGDGRPAIETEGGRPGLGLHQDIACLSNAGGVSVQATPSARTCSRKFCNTAIAPAGGAVIRLKTR